ncbi:MAG TPA: portal protein, partial [Sphingomicrobium sp.]|nr:portal protein [Sphingomicrobium sp.]
DSDNGWQWLDTVKQDRDIARKPCITINKTKMHVLMLANEARQNQPSARIKPVGDKVSYDAAEIWEGLLRHIEYVSNAQSVYIKAKEDQLEGGVGYWRITHDYADDRSFDQEIRLEPLEPPSVYLDCDIKRTDGSDAMWGFIFEEYDRKEFERHFPDIDLPPPRSPGIDDHDDWIRKDAVRVAEYYRIDLQKDELIYLEDDQGESWTGLRSEIPSRWRKVLELYASGDVGDNFKSRPIMNRQLQWFKIGGNEIIERKDGANNHEILKGHYIPICRMVGRERKIHGQLHRAGIVRQLKDAQRMYNYNTSGEVEVVALQTKSPWIVAAAAIEGNEAAWENANITNAAYLTFRHIDDEGNPIPAPTRLNPPAPAGGFLEGIRIAAAEMEMATGQYQPQNVQQNAVLERTPKAIDLRQRMGDLANYDFTDNATQAIRHCAVIIIDLAPHIYDTERVLKIRAQDGTISEITIDPKLDDAYQKLAPNKDGEAIKVLFNPKIGKYAVEADVGPAYQTQRQEAWNAFIQIVTSSPELMMIIGDLGFLAADYPMADKIAERIKRHIAANMPWLLDDSKIGPVLADLQQKLSNSQSQLGDTLLRLSEARLRLKGKDELRDIEGFNAETRRMDAIIKAVKELMPTPAMRAQFEHEIAQDARQHVYSVIEGANSAALSGNAQGNDNGKSDMGGFDPTAIGARLARDGHHYLPDPSRPGKYLLVSA